MSVFTEQMHKMDAIVDQTLGDDPVYKRAGDPGFVKIAAWFIPVEAVIGLAEIDDLPQRWRFKVAKTIIPAISDGDRIKRSTAPGEIVYAPAGTANADAGRYWIFDLEKV